ncbi:MAG: hypothetical protein LJE83_02105 [Gammaproteobacteria bacterium]|nr:hypothetical protein [Gammaproteobacteria bacterium]
MSKSPSRKLLACLLAGALFSPQTGFTLGLGEIEVNSVLNQKLNAEIELLSATPEDAETIIVKLASRNEFQRAGLDRPYSLNDLRFKSEVINGTPYIKVSTGVPIREPFLNFLIEVDWPNGHLLREYTILLDPPVFMTQQADSTPVSTSSDESEFRPAAAGSTNVVPVAAPTSIDTGSFRPSQGQGSVSQSQAFDTGASQTVTYIPAPVAQQQTTMNQPPGSYRVKKGDTAWSLATAMRPDQSISVYQMMIALLKANPESFIDENVNGLKRGYILRVPDYDQIAAVSDDEARALVREQAALWRQYQQSRAGGQPVSAMQTGDAAAESGSQGGAESADQKAFLEIVSAGTGTSTNSGKVPANMTTQELRAELALAREKVETERVEKEALRRRVDELEQHVEQMKGMLSIEDEDLSRVQSLNLPPEDAEMSAEPAAGTDSMEEGTVSMDEAEATEGNAEDMPEPGMTEEAPEDTEQATSQVTELDELFLADENAARSDESMAEAQQAAAPAVDVTPPQAENPPPADLLAQIMSDPLRLAAAGGGLLLIAVFTGLIIKRRKMAAESATSNAFENLDVLADKAEKSTGAIDEERIAESMAGGSVSASGIEISEDESGIAAGKAKGYDEQPETSAVADDDKPRDDVIAEADVYLAYGIYQQAEELLKQAIKDHPDRNDYRLKLAETHYASKNSEAFIEIAGEIKKNVDSDDSPEWKKAVVMGMDLCPENSMFQASLADEVDADAVTAELPSSEKPSMDDDLTLAETEKSFVEDSGDSSDRELYLDDLELDDETPDLSELDDTGTTDITDESAALPETAEETASLDVSAEQADEIEFDFNDTVMDETASTEEDELSLDIDLSEMDADLDEEAESELVSEIDAKQESPAQADTELGIASVDESAAEEEVLIDLSDEIDVASMEPDELEDVKTAVNDALENEDDFDLSSLGDVDEISTKLDLARAYLDMGDSEGTRGILEEVLADGNDEQKQEANELMAKLG